MKIVGKKNVSEAIKKSHENINKKAEELRHAEGTTHTVMSAIYRMKYEEAKRIHSGSTEPTPLIDAESQYRGVSKHRLANMIMEKHFAWITRMAEIEVQRLSAKDSVAKMKDTREIEVFHNTVLGGE